MNCETIWDVVISTPVPIRHVVAAAQTSAPVATTSSEGLFETLIGLAVEMVAGMAAWIVYLWIAMGFMYLLGLCLAAVVAVLDAFSPKPPHRSSMTSVSSTGRRQIDDLSDAYVRSAARTLFGR